MISRMEPLNKNYTCDTTSGTMSPLCVTSKDASLEGSHVTSSVHSQGHATFNEVTPMVVVIRLLSE